MRIYVPHIRSHLGSRAEGCGGFPDFFREEVYGGVGCGKCICPDSFVHDGAELLNPVHDGFSNGGGSDEAKDEESKAERSTV